MTRGSPRPSTSRPGARCTSCGARRPMRSSLTCSTTRSTPAPMSSAAARSKSSSPGGRLIRRQRSYALAPEDCRVFLRDHHEGYIRWETYEEHVRMIGAMPTGDGETRRWRRFERARGCWQECSAAAAAVDDSTFAIGGEAGPRRGTSAKGRMTRAASGTASGSAAARWTSASARSCFACSRRWAFRPVWLRSRRGAVRRTGAAGPCGCSVTSSNTKPSARSSSTTKPIPGTGSSPPSWSGAGMRNSSRSRRCERRWPRPRPRRRR